MPHERLIVNDNDDDTERELTIAPVSMPADVYAAALTITQVGTWLTPTLLLLGLIVGTKQLWTLRRPFAHLRDKYRFILMLRTLRTGNLAGVALPEEVPVHVAAVLRDCLNDDPQARPTAGKLLARLETLL